jgi:hypothetical protein
MWWDSALTPAQVLADYLAGVKASKLLGVGHSLLAADGVDEVNGAARIFAGNQSLGFVDRAKTGAAIAQQGVDQGGWARTLSRLVPLSSTRSGARLVRRQRPRAVRRGTPATDPS